MNFPILAIAVFVLVQELVAAQVLDSGTDLISYCDTQGTDSTFDYRSADGYIFVYECYEEGNKMGYRPIYCKSDDNEVHEPGSAFINGYFKYECTKPSSGEIQLTVIACVTPEQAVMIPDATYGTARLGTYQYLSERFTQSSSQPLSYPAKVTIGITSGAVGAICGNPAEVSLIRMTLDSRLPIDQQRGYRNVFHAFSSIVSQEGITTLWRGCFPTVIRAMVVNAAVLSTYSQTKQLLIQKGIMKDNLVCHSAAASVSGFACVVASLPVDMAKTRVQNMRVIDGVPEYKGMRDVLVQIIRTQGFRALYSGFLPYFARIAPYTVLSFIFLEQLNQAYFTYVLRTEKVFTGL